MTKNPFINAVIAGTYIIIVVLLISNMPYLVKEEKETILIPMAMLSLLVFSATFMGLTFFFQPAQMYMDGNKKEAVNLFLKTLAVFAVITILFFTILIFNEKIPQV